MREIEELAEYCRESVKERINNFRKLKETLYIEITPPNRIKKSLTYHILEDACANSQFLLINKYEYVINCWVRIGYDIQFINEKKEVTDATTGIDEDFAIKVIDPDEKPKLVLCNTTNNIEYYRIESPWDKGEKIQRLWNLYIKLSIIKNEKEREEIANQYKNEM